MVIRPNKILSIGGEKSDITGVKLAELAEKCNLPIFYEGPPPSYPFYKRHDMDARRLATRRILEHSESLKSGWALVSRENAGNPTPLLTQYGNWTGDQNRLLLLREERLAKQGVDTLSLRQQTATEALWDSLLYYASCHEELYQNVFNLTSTVCRQYAIELGRYETFTYSGGGSWSRGDHTSDRYSAPTKYEFVKYRSDDLSYICIGKGLSVMAAFPEEDLSSVGIYFQR